MGKRCPFRIKGIKVNPSPTCGDYSFESLFTCSDIIGSKDYKLFYENMVKNVAALSNFPFCLHKKMFSNCVRFCITNAMHFLKTYR